MKTVLEQLIEKLEKLRNESISLLEIGVLNIVHAEAMELLPTEKEKIMNAHIEANKQHFLMEHGRITDGRLKVLTEVAEQYFNQTYRE